MTIFKQRITEAYDLSVKLCGNDEFETEVFAEVIAAIRAENAWVFYRASQWQMRGNLLICRHSAMYLHEKWKLGKRCEVTQ